VYFDVPGLSLSPQPLYLNYAPGAQNILPLQFRGAIYRALTHNSMTNDETNASESFGSYRTNLETSFYIMVTNHVPNGEVIRLGFLKRGDSGDPPTLDSFPTNFFQH